MAMLVSRNSSSYWFDDTNLHLRVEIYRLPNREQLVELLLLLLLIQYKDVSRSFNPPSSFLVWHNCRYTEWTYFYQRLSALLMIHFLEISQASFKNHLFANSARTVHPSLTIIVRSKTAIASRLLRNNS